MVSIEMKVAPKQSLNSLAFLTRPDDAAFKSMLEEMAATGSWRGVAAVLGISQLTLNSWRKGQNGPSAGARKLVWLVWAMMFHPEKLRSPFDIVTWGRYVRPREKQPESSPEPTVVKLFRMAGFIE